MKKLTERQPKTIARFLREGKPLPQEFRDHLIPSKKEYESVYAGKERKEDITANTMAAPPQPVKAFGK